MARHSALLFRMCPPLWFYNQTSKTAFLTHNRTDVSRDRTGYEFRSSLSLPQKTDSPILWLFLVKNTTDNVQINNLKHKYIHDIFAGSAKFISHPLVTLLLCAFLISTVRATWTIHNARQCEEKIDQHAVLDLYYGCWVQSLPYYYAVYIRRELMKEHNVPKDCVQILAHGHSKNNV